MADVLEVGAPDSVSLDLRLAMKALRAHGIFSVLCEGGPRLAASLLSAGVIDRFYWAIAPRLLSADAAVPVLCGADLPQRTAALRPRRAHRRRRDHFRNGVILKWVRV